MTDRAESPEPAGRNGSPRPAADLVAGLLDQAVLRQAAALLMARYDLPDSAVAARAVTIAARRHDRDPRAVARALLVAPEPRRSARSWFPHRVWTSAPPLGFLPDSTAIRPVDVLGAALDAATDRAQTSQGDIQTVSPGRGGLDLRRAQGFSAEFVEHFAHVDGDETACAIALATRRPVTLPDITTCGIFDEPALETLTDAGVRAVRSIPVPIDPTRCVGVLSVHFGKPGSTPTHATRFALSGIAAQTGAWLDWYSRTAMLDALEDLHRHAGRFPAM